MAFGVKLQKDIKLVFETNCKTPSVYKNWFEFVDGANETHTHIL